jgi:hypothetical protein
MLQQLPTCTSGDGKGAVKTAFHVLSWRAEMVEQDGIINMKH